MILILQPSQIAKLFGRSYPNAGLPRHRAIAGRAGSDERDLLGLRHQARDGRAQALSSAEGVAMKPECPTCLAMRFDEMTVELAHCTGVAFGVALTGDYQPEEAGQIIKETFCAEHADLIFGSARVLADKARDLS